MKYLLLSITFFLFLNAKGQTSVKDQIVGNWKVKNVIVKSNSKEMTELSQTFTNSIFSFQKNQNFNFIPKQKTPLKNNAVFKLEEAELSLEVVKTE